MERQLVVVHVMLRHASVAEPEENLRTATRRRSPLEGPHLGGEDSGPANVPANLASTATVSPDSTTVCTTMWHLDRRAGTPLHRPATPPETLRVRAQARSSPRRRG